MKNEIIKRVDLHKPNQLINISTNQITTNQIKAYNYILHKAKSELQENEIKNVFYFSYSEIEKMLDGKHDKNNKYLFETLHKLSQTNIEVVKDSKNWAVFNLIASVKRKDEELRIQLPVDICEVLLDNSYTTLDLLSIREMKSKYTIMFYEFSQKYLKINFPIWSIKEFKELLGITNKKTYNNFANISRKILIPAVKELAEKEKIFLDYKLTKRGKRYDTIQFFIVEEVKSVTDKNREDKKIEKAEARMEKQTKREETRKKELEEQEKHSLKIAESKYKELSEQELDNYRLKRERSHKLMQGENLKQFIISYLMIESRSR